MIVCDEQHPVEIDDLAVATSIGTKAERKFAQASSWDRQCEICGAHRGCYTVRRWSDTEGWLMDVQCPNCTKRWETAKHLVDRRSAIGFSDVAARVDREEAEQLRSYLRGLAWHNFSVWLHLTFSDARLLSELWENPKGRKRLIRIIEEGRSESEQLALWD